MVLELDVWCMSFERRLLRRQLVFVPVIRDLFPALLVHEVPGPRVGDGKEGLEGLLIKAALRAFSRVIGEETYKLIGA